MFAAPPLCLFFLCVIKKIRSFWLCRLAYSNFYPFSLFSTWEAFSLLFNLLALYCTVQYIVLMYLHSLSWQFTWVFQWLQKKVWKIVTNICNVLSAPVQLVLLLIIQDIIFVSTVGERIICWVLYLYSKVRYTVLHCRGVIPFGRYLFFLELSFVCTEMRRTLLFIHFIT